MTECKIIFTFHVINRWAKVQSTKIILKSVGWFNKDLLYFSQAIQRYFFKTKASSLSPRLLR